MKSIVFGIWGARDAKDFTRQREVFACHGQRQLLAYRFDDFWLYGFKGSSDLYIADHERYFICVTGDHVLPQISVQPDADPQAILPLLRQQLTGPFMAYIYDKAGRSLQIGGDRFGCYPTFYRHDKKHFMFCNEYQPLALREGKLLPVSKKKLLFFLRYGFVKSGDTLLDEVRMLGRTTISISQHGMQQSTSALPAQDTARTYEDWVSALHNALKRAVNRFFPATGEHRMVTLTGGLDTRMILALIDESERQQQEYLSFYMHPLDPSNDKDVLVATQVAAAYGLKLNVVEFDEKTNRLNASYFDKIRNDGISVLTGLFGGELLSGLLYQNVMPGNTDRIVNQQRSIKLMLDHGGLLRYLRKHGKRQVYFEVLTTSFATSVYRGTEGDWMHPWLNLLRYPSPFLDREFLELWFSIPEAFIFSGSHNLVFDIYRKFFPEFRNIPTNSTLPGLKENGFTYFEEGIEPKVAKTLKSANLAESISNYRGYALIPEKMRTEAYLSDANNRQRVLDFCVWYDYYHAMPFRSGHES